MLTWQATLTPEQFHQIFQSALPIFKMKMDPVAEFFNTALLLLRFYRILFMLLNARLMIKNKLSPVALTKLTINYMRKEYLLLDVMACFQNDENFSLLISKIENKQLTVN